MQTLRDDRLMSGGGAAGPEPGEARPRSHRVREEVVGGVQPVGVHLALALDVDLSARLDGELRAKLKTAHAPSVSRGAPFV